MPGALTRIRARGHIGIRLGLGRMQALLTTLGEPQRSLRGALIAGTNGKGSVAAIVGTVLSTAGRSVGLSPSPHLHSYRERVTINGVPIGATELDALLEEVLAASEPGQDEFGPATEFELLTAAAYLEAARREVDVMIMEVGLGGRLDASNTWDPDVAAVTNVGLDHQEYLGHTIESIAVEKAAIIKPGSRAVTGAQGEALRIIADRAREVEVPLTECPPLPIASMDADGLVLQHERLGELRLPLLGRHQAANAAVALGVLDALAASGVAEVDVSDIRAGFERVTWPGRLERVRSRGRTIILDGAHNPDGMAVLADTVDAIGGELPVGPGTVLLGVMRDKVVDDMLRALARSDRLASAHLIATGVPDTDRALAAEELASRWRDMVRSPVTAMADADAALDAALGSVDSQGGPLVIAGSLYLIGHLRRRLVEVAITDARA